MKIREWNWPFIIGLIFCGLCWLMVYNKAYGLPYTVTTVFDSTNYNQNPHIVKAPNGDLLSFWIGGNYPEGNTNIVSRMARSTDGGLTWGGAHTLGADGALSVLKKNDILYLFHQPFEINDASLNGRDGVNHGAEYAVVSDTTGYRFVAAEGDYIDCNADWIGTGNVTISGRFYHESTQNGRIISNGKSVAYIYNTRLALSRDGINTIAYTTASMPLNAWVNFVIRSTSTGGTKFFINGELSAADSIAGTPAAGTGNLLIGWQPGFGGVPFDGLLANIQVRNWCCSDAQADSIYKGTIADNALGPELIATTGTWRGGFDAADSTSWEWDSSWYATLNSGVATKISGTNNHMHFNMGTTTYPKRFRCIYAIRSVTVGGIDISPGEYIGGAIKLTVGSFSEDITVTEALSDSYLTIFTGNGGGFVGTIDSVSVRQVQNKCLWYPLTTSPTALYMSVSTDNGVSWRDSVTIDTTIWGLYNMHDPIILDNGDWLIPFHNSVGNPISTHQHVTIWNGSTWTTYGDIRALPDTTKWICEGTVVQLADNSLLMYMRTSLGYIYKSISTDRGHTWSAAEATIFLNPGSPPCLLKLASGNILLAYNDNTLGNGVNNRWPIRVALSRDNGITWPYSMVITAGINKEQSYMSLMEANGKIYCVYNDGGTSTIGWGKQDIICVTFTERQLLGRNRRMGEISNAISNEIKTTMREY